MDSAPKKALVAAFFVTLAISTLYPLFIIVITSGKSLVAYQRDPLGLPSPWTFENFQQAWTQANIGTYAVNSAIVVALSVAILVAVATPAGFAFAQMDFPLRRALLVAMISLVVVSPNQLMVPVFKITQDLNLLNEYHGLALVNAALHLPFGIYLMAAYFEGVPRALFQSAAIDGAGPFRAFLGIALPIARPGVLTLITFQFISFWNEFLFALLLLQAPEKRTLPVGIQQLTTEAFVSQPLLSAGLVFALVPCVIMFLLLQRNLNEGLTAGAVKQ